MEWILIVGILSGCNYTVMQTPNLTKEACVSLQKDINKERRPRTEGHGVIITEPSCLNSTTGEIIKGG